jgi:hypothetical protein
MGTTTSGLRYPDPTDPVNQGAAAIKNLADDVTAQYSRPARGVANVTANPAGTLYVLHNLNRTFQAILITETNTTAMKNVWVRPNTDFSNPNQFAASAWNSAGAPLANAPVQFHWAGI